MAVPEEPRLLARALESLEPEERQRVTAWLLARTSGSRRSAWLTPEPHESSGPDEPDDPAEQRDRVLDSLGLTDPRMRRVYAAQAFASPALRELLGQQLASAGSLRGEHQLVPVRLPAELHARLRDWCAAHDFTMATVIRGLTAKFLESQPD